MVSLHVGLPDDQRDAAAAVLWEAFRGKLGAALGDDVRAQRFLSATFDAASVLWAERDGTLLGLLVLAGIPGASPSSGTREARVLWDIYGPSALPRLALLAFMESDPPEDGLLVDAAAVAGAARGQGVGTMLLEQAEAVATSHGLAALELEVIDANPAAKALYERLGYVSIGHEPVPWPLSRLLGIRGSTRMRRRLH